MVIILLFSIDYYKRGAFLYRTFRSERNIGKIVRIANYNWSYGVKPVRDYAGGIELHQDIASIDSLAAVFTDFIVTAFKLYRVYADVDKQFDARIGQQTDGVAGLKHLTYRRFTGRAHMSGFRLDSYAAPQDILAEDGILQLWNLNDDDVHRRRDNNLFFAKSKHFELSVSWKILSISSKNHIILQSVAVKSSFVRYGNDG